MLDLNDSQWNNLTGGYGTPYSPVTAIRRLSDPQTQDAAWEELWSELHHQGDVGSASVAAVPHIVASYVNSDEFDWNPYALVATIDLSWGGSAIPDYTRESYERAIHDLARLATRDLERCSEEWQFSTVCAVIAIDRKWRSWATLLHEYTEDEIDEIITNS